MTKKKKKLYDVIREFAEDLELESFKMNERGEYTACEILTDLVREMNDAADSLSATED